MSAAIESSCCLRAFRFMTLLYGCIDPFPCFILFHNYHRKTHNNVWTIRVTNCRHFGPQRAEHACTIHAISLYVSCTYRLLLCFALRVLSSDDVSIYFLFRICFFRLVLFSCEARLQHVHYPWACHSSYSDFCLYTILHVCLHHFARWLPQHCTGWYKKVE